MNTYTVRIGETTVAIDATKMTMEGGRRRFEIYTNQEIFICSIEVWGPHVCEPDVLDACGDQGIQVTEQCSNKFCPEHGQRGGDRQVQDVGAVAYPALCDKCRSQQ